MVETVRPYSGVLAVSNRLFDFHDRARDPAGSLATSIGAVVEPGQALAGEQGFGILLKACAALEHQFDGLLSGRDGMSHFAAIRHVSPGLWLSQPYAHGPTRSIAELAIHRWCAFLDDPPHPYELPDFSEEEMDRVADVLATADTYGALMATRRRVAKGQKVTVLNVAPFGVDFSDNTNGIADLISVRDARVEANLNLLAPFAGMLLDGTATDHDHRVVAAEYIPVQEFAPYFGPNPPNDLVVLGDGTGFGIRMVHTLARVFRSGFLAYLTERTAHLSVLDDELLAAHGFGVADIDAALECLTVKVVGAGGLPWSFENHGFAVVGVPTENELAAAAEAARDPMGRTLTAASVRAAMAYLDCGLHPIPLSQPLLQLPLRRMGRSVLYDGAQLQTSPTILWESELSDPVKQKLEKGFERVVQTQLSSLGPQPYVSGQKLRRPDNSVITDVDACVQLEGLLVVVDCYGAPWRASLDDGTNAQTRNRAQTLAAKLREWQGQWDDIVNNYPHLLPAGVTNVLPVVVTPGPEWIASWHADLWLSGTTPNICTVAELSSHIAGSGAAPTTA